MLLSKTFAQLSQRLILVALSLPALLLVAGTVLAAPCDIKPGAPPFVQHDLGNSYCELCNYSYVTVEITNPYAYTSMPGPDLPGASMSAMTLEEDLGSSGLTYDPTAPSPVSYRVNGGPLLAGSAPVISGSRLTFTAASIPPLAQLDSRPENTLYDSISIRVAVRRTTTPENLLTANRTIQATLNFNTDSGCSDSPRSDTDSLPLREPIPQVVKTGWNYDAGQRQGSQSDPVYGNNNDDIVWRVRINNLGQAALQDLRFDDLLQSGGMQISAVCASDTLANSIASNNGAGLPAGCVSATNSINDFIVTNPFGARGLAFDGYEIDVPAGGTTSLYLVGKVSTGGSCETSKTNTVSNVQWGCEVQTPAGGISQTSAGTTAGDVATFFSRYEDVSAPLSVERRLTGTNTSQPVGSKGTMTITIRNNSRGSVKNIHLADLLPAEYVMDRSFRPQLTVTPAYGNYPGLVNALIWTNENSSDPLANTAPEFDLTSNGTSHPVYADQVNMLRHGDVAVIRFRVVLINSDYYDRNANLDVNPEEFPVSLTDPGYQTPLSNRLTVNFDLFCASQPSQTLVLTGNGTGNPSGTAIAAFPEDLDIAVGGSVFILTNDPAQLLTIPLLLTNRGGHDAANYRAFVSFGTTMEVVNAPAGCSLIPLVGSPNQPDPWKVWTLPAPIPATATVYACSSPAVITPGQTVTYNFNVRKSSDAVRIAADDLSLRADVVGEITLSDGTPLWFPAPLLRSDGEQDRANNYSVDATWARVIGFNLKKNQLGSCNENNPPSYDANGFEEVQIGEECRFHIETGGWFGFKTPGFAYIAVQNIDLVDEVPDGQAYLSSTNPLLSSTPLIKNVTLNPSGLTALDEGWFDWRFNVSDSDQIRVADEWFVVDTRTRLLNKAVDQRLAPNLHAANSHNLLTSDFDATFQNDNTGLTEKYTLGPTTVGYPNEAIRRVDLTLSEPLISLVKEVCNESLYGAGPACSNFVPLADDGDAYSSYIYRLTLSNEASAGGVQRAPAYDVVVTDQLDASDLTYVAPFATDGLDNDADGASGAADGDGEGTISDNLVKNAVPAQLTFSYTHSNALQRIDPGQSVQLFYRVDFDDDAAPQQTFINSAVAVYDSLSGEYGSQSTPQRANSDLAGARVYTSTQATARVRILPVVARPKTILHLSNTPLLAVPGTQPVSIGEEIEYQLETLLPVALLRNFVVRDLLPPGLSCSQAPAVNLSAAPYSAAGFQPGGTIIPSCAGDQVTWNFGTQRLTIGSAGSRFPFALRFIARVDNSGLTNNGDLLSNGSPATLATAEYLDEQGRLVTNAYGQVDVEVREPLLALTKTFNVAGADAADRLTVTVTATNNGTATAYNLRVLDNLVGTDLSYAGNPAGLDPPDTVDLTTLGPNRPIFSWTSPNGIAAGSSRSFTFEVSIADGVQPQQVLTNSIQADWTSLPGRTTALNSSGSIGADGSATGQRNGRLPHAADPLNDYEATASSQLSVNPPSLGKTDLSLTSVPAIGLHKLFRIDINLPEGISNGVLVSDSLDAAGLSYVLANNAAFDIRYVFDGIVSINGQAPAEAAFNSYPADAASGSVSWDIGTLVTQVENDTSQNLIQPAVHIEYFARINNDLVTDAGDLLRNGASLSYRNGATGLPETLTAATAAVSVSEPDLTLTKTLANVTLGKSPADPPFAGDILEYRLTAVNTGSSNSTAFDINIVDTLPPGLVLDASFTTTATIDALAVPGFVALPAGAPAGPLVWGRDNGDGSLDLPAGQVLVITYRTRVQVIADPAGVIENGVWSDWTSLANTSSYERTGAGCPLITAPDDYCVGPVFATTIGVAPELVFQKTVINQTSGQDPGISASPGDVLRYRLLVTNISTAPAFFDLTDELDQLNSPALFVSGSLSILSNGGGTDNSNPNGGSAATGLVAISDLTLAGGASLVIEFSAQLATVIANGTLALNQAQLVLSGLGIRLSDDPNLIGNENPTQTLIQSAPLWSFEKTALDLTGAPGILFAGDQLRYTLRLKNIGNENASGVTLRDAIPAATSYIAGSTRLNGNPVADPTTGISALEGGLLVNAPEDLTAGSMRADAAATADNVATLSFDVQVDPAAASGTLIANQGFVNGAGTGSGAFPEQPSDDPDSVAVNDPTIRVVSSLDFFKNVFNDTTGGSGASATPGDRLRYRLVLVNTGTVSLADLAIVDDLESLQPAEPRLFVPGSLTLLSTPAGADISGTDPSGGSKGTGRVEVRNLSLLPGETLVVEFSLQLAPVITNGSLVLNQAQLNGGGQPLRLSDAADLLEPGSEDPTRTLISSAPAFVVQKTSTILSGDPAVLLAGERLRYTLTIRNVGTEDAVAALLRDSTPANTSYVAGSTTLNGQALADAVPGISPLHAGILLNATENRTPGYLRADSRAGATNLAVVTFEVLVDATAMDGLIIENQGFVSGSGAGSGPFAEQPSDDPATPVADDPTRNLVGNLPLLYAHKTVALLLDNGTPGIVDPGDQLRYRILITNYGPVPASAVTLRDNLPGNTSYLADTLRLNGLSLGPDAGVLPLIAGLPVNSSDNPGIGIISAGQSAEVVFTVLVNAGTPTGTLISNQGTVTSAELVPGLTDADGLASNGFQPTVTVVGDVQLLAITKEVRVVNGGSAEPGAELSYLVRVTNIGRLAATRVVIIDDLSPPLGDQLSYIAGSGSMNGLSSGISFAGNLLSADYGGVYGDLAPGASVSVRFRAQINPTLARGTTITNLAVVRWNSPQQSATAAVSLDVGGTPGSAAFSGRVWHDVNLDRVYDAGTENGQQTWQILVYLLNQPVATTTTDAGGRYQLTGLLASANAGGLYEVRFRAPGAGPATASLGTADSPFTDGLQRITDVSLGEGSNLQQLNLPLWPNGTVYNAIARGAVAGARLRMRNAVTAVVLPGTCFDDPVQQDQMTVQNGFYKFDLNFSDATCPAGGSYLIETTAPASGYLATPSRIIPPSSDAATAPFSVPACPGSAVDAVPATAAYCEAVSSGAAPPLSVPARSAGTSYYLHLLLSNGTLPGQSQIFNNPIPIDPELDGAVAISKTADLTSVSKGDLVPYTIRLTNVYGVPLDDLRIIDRFPAGFKYVAGSARLDGVAREPLITGRELLWDGLQLTTGEVKTLKLLLVVGAGVNEGEYVNRAQVLNTTLGTLVSGEAAATVRVTPDPDMDCTDLIGKVFDDRNLNGRQDDAEPGLSGVRLVTARGLISTTDAYGRYHISCAVVPDADRGSNFILKLDDRSLPSGYRVISENPRVQRATRGKLLRFNFAAAIHRVVAMNIADGVFEPGTSRLRLQWQGKIDQLLKELKSAPSILRLSYLADVEHQGLVHERIATLKAQIAERWRREEQGYSLGIETEVFWRRGGPP